MFDKNGYYNTNKLKSYEAEYYIVTSERGLGKTYGEKKALFKNYVRRGHKFACVYRTGSDMVDTLGGWLLPLTNPAPLDKMKPVPAEDFEWEKAYASGYGWNLKYQGDTIGYFRALSASNKFKLESFPLQISECFFDEFCPMNWTKIPGVYSEGEALQTLLITMDHDTQHKKKTLGYPPIKTVMFGNPRNRNSPLFEFFHIPALKFGITRVGGKVVCEQIEPVPEKKDSVISNDAQKCLAWLETTSHVRKVPKGSYPWISMRLEDHYYTTYYHPKLKISVIAQKREHTNAGIILGTLDHLEERETCLDFAYKKKTYKKVLQDRVNASADYFESVETKYSYIQHII